MWQSPSHDRDEGFGIVELIIAMALTGVLSVITYKVITSFELIQQATLSSQAATASADLGSTALTRLLGEAVTTGQGAILSASPSSVSFNAITTSGQLGVEHIWLPNTTCPCQIDAQFSTGATSGAVTNLGITTMSTQLFQYYQTPTNPNDLSQAQIAVPNEGTNDGTFLAQIALVEVEITEQVIDRGMTTTQAVIAVPGSTGPTATQEGGTS